MRRARRPFARPYFGGRGKQEKAAGGKSAEARRAARPSFSPPPPPSPPFSFLLTSGPPASRGCCCCCRCSPPLIVRRSPSTAALRAGRIQAGRRASRSGGPRGSPLPQPEATKPRAAAAATAIAAGWWRGCSRRLRRSSRKSLADLDPSIPG
ncbi:Hypothetical predicted protein [Podarcis lilfordi]|uniref:Uncharacterized protein n=1 Tax=Podarcis lilfordi TaxID=74358 RepID=A0AA35PA44_9SAUR|nr:Hypothetical predicted protein [Podarcis lilfordi]